MATCKFTDLHSVQQCGWDCSFVVGCCNEDNLRQVKRNVQITTKCTVKEILAKHVDGRIQWLL